MKITSLLLPPSEHLDARLSALRLVFVNPRCARVIRRMRAVRAVRAPCE